MFISLIRTILLYILIIIAVRLMGKRQIGELEPPELVITILLSELAAIPMQDSNIPLVAGVVPMIALIAIEIITSFLCLKSQRFRRLVNGRPAVIIQEGKLLRNKLRDLRITTDEVLEALRQRDIFDISEVKYGIMEANGQLSCILFPKSQPATAQMVHAKPAPIGLPLVLIADGKANVKNCVQLGVTPVNLQTRIEKAGFSMVSQVFLLTLDAYDNQFLQGMEGV